MKNKFLQYYPLSKKTKQKILKSGILIFDASSLLDLYTYTLSTIAKVLDILEKNKDRIWLPYQFAFEYHKNRLKNIEKQSKSYEKIIKELEEKLKKLDSLPCTHPFLDVERKAHFDFKKSFFKIKKQLDTYNNKNPIWFKKDFVMDKITKLYKNKIGDEFDETSLKKIIEEGQDRHNKDIPPGYSDKDKKENKFGDWIGWKQILEKGRETKESMIFITNDVKEDWWLLSRDKRIISPRPELIKEFRIKTGKYIIFYTMDRFLKTIDKFNTKAIQEIKEKNKYHESLNSDNIAMGNLSVELQTSNSSFPSALDDFYDGMVDSRPIEEGKIAEIPKIRLKEIKALFPSKVKKKMIKNLKSKKNKKNSI